MDLYSNHHRHEQIFIDKTYTIEDDLKSPIYYQTYGYLSGKNEALFPELIFRYNNWYFLVVLFICLLIAQVLVIFFPAGGPYGTPNFQDSLGSMVYAIVIIILGSIAIKRFADLRYLYFQGDKVIFQSRTDGRRVYAAKDLKFHVLEIGRGICRYQLEVELPDETLLDYRRLIVLEAAATKKTLNALIATLLPMCRGDSGPYEKAIKREYDLWPDGVKPTRWRRWVNMNSHFHILFLDYKMNQFLFWLVHGSREKILAKEEKNSSTRLRMAGVALPARMAGRSG